MDIQRISIQAGLGNLSLIRNPLRRPPGYQGETSSGPPPAMSLLQYPRRVPANAFPNRLPPGYPPPGYPTPSHHISGHPFPGHPIPGLAIPGQPTLGHSSVLPAHGHGHGHGNAPASAASADPAPPPTRLPPVRPYIRPAIEEDAMEVAQIINYYKGMFPFDPEFEPMEPKHVRNFIEACKLRKLPFVVLVKPLGPSQTSQEPPKSQICGICYVDLFEEEITDRSDGDLRVYIRPGMTRHGYGTLLVDCILSICDEYYRRKFQFEWRPVGDVQLQVLRLRELACVIPYPAQLELNYWFVWQWLKNTFGFLKLGEVKQDRAKYGYE